jgi:hypothetical protein
LKIGSTSFSLNSGQAKRIDLKINRLGRLLGRAGRMPARASILAKGAGSTPATGAVVVIKASSH